MMKNTMRNTMKRNTLSILLIALLALTAMQVQAVNYQTKYKGTKYNVQCTTSFGAATAPVAAFQSTSVYAPSEWTEKPMLNSDGTVNEGVYMAGQNNAPSGPRKAKDPDDDEDDPYNGPIGDALIPLFLLALAYAVYKVSRRRKEATDN